MSNFSFVKNSTLRNNLDIAFDHVITLISLSESKDYKKLEKSSFRKTIIINTASIIEALLSNIIDQKCKTEDLITHEWVVENPKNLHIIDNKNKIIGCNYVYKGKKMKLEKMNLNIINKLLYDKKLIKPSLYKEIDEVRKLRNDQHFGTHQVIKEYTKSNLRFVFSVAKKIKTLSKNLL